MDAFSCPQAKADLEDVRQQLAKGHAQIGNYKDSWKTEYLNDFIQPSVFPVSSFLRIALVCSCFVAELQEEKSKLEEEVSNLKKQHEEAVQKLDEEKQEELKNLQETLNKEKDEEFSKSKTIIETGKFEPNAMYSLNFLNNHLLPL